jgi:DNA-binding transcriptional LysR family regulator
MNSKDFAEGVGIDLRHLRYFVAVAEELHFGRAAARLGISQPPLSQQIQHLERTMGVVLLERTNRRVRLTPAGAVLLERARRLLGAMEEAVEATRGAARGEVGTLSVAFAASVMFLALPRIIREFRVRYPGVHLELRELPTGTQIEALLAGELDVGFLRQPADNPLLHLEPVMRDPLLIALNAQHPLARRARVPLAALAQERFVLFPRDLAPGLYALVLSLCREAGFVPHVVQESRELYTTVSLVEAGMGVTIVPASVRKLGWRGVVYKSIREPGALSTVAVSWRVDASNPVIRSFVEVVRRVVR